MQYKENDLLKTFIEGIYQDLRNDLKYGIINENDIDKIIADFFLEAVLRDATIRMSILQCFDYNALLVVSSHENYFKSKLPNRQPFRLQQEWERLLGHTLDKILNSIHFKLTTKAKSI